jgi:hypothetical protein
LGEKLVWTGLRRGVITKEGVDAGRERGDREKRVMCETEHTFSLTWILFSPIESESEVINLHEKFSLTSGGIEGSKTLSLITTFNPKKEGRK